MCSTRHLIAAVGVIVAVVISAAVMWGPSALLAGITVNLTDFVIDPGASVLT